MKSIKSIRIPDGVVRQLKLNGVVLWKQDVVEQLTAPSIQLNGDILTMVATDNRTKEFVILVDGVEMVTVANLISFTIDSTLYQAVEGMAWGEWVESEYNTGGYTIWLEYITLQGNNDSIISGATTTSLIIANTAYGMSSGSPDNPGGKE